MKRFLFLLLLFTSQGSSAQDSLHREIVITPVTVLTMESATPLRQQTVVVRGGRVVTLGDAGKVRYSSDAQVIDGTGKYLMPGLAEMHAHVPPVPELEPMQEVLSLFTARG
ncbi:MAG TPA: hypothetical protein VHK69_02795, partial [Chitinophagaceae bacterium]|nr:hypothetical protein [Chitinophagaceae bacterium]